MQETFEQVLKIAGIWFDRLMLAMAAFGAVLILAMALIIGYDVLMRRVFDSPTIWALDVTEYALLYVTFLAAPIVLRREGHVRMTAISEILRPTPRKVLYIGGMIAASIASGILAWQSLFTLLDQIERSSSILGGIRVPQPLVFWIIPFGFFLLSLQSMRMAVASLTAFLRHEETEQTASAGI